MKKVVAFINSLTSYLFIFPALAYAVEDTVVVCPEGQFKTLCQLSSSNFGRTIGTLVTFAFIAAIIIALIFLIWGGIKWITSGGDKTAVEEARNHIVAAIVGLVIVFLVYFILNLVVFFFTGTSIFNIKIPSLPQS